MAKATPIEGKVSAILTDRTLAINRGREHGVRTGMKFAINLIVGPIEDPDDPSNVLKSLKYTKSTARVTQVFTRMSLCDIDVRTRTLYPGLFRFYEQTVEDAPELAEPLISKEQWTVKRGDPVEEIIEPPPPPPVPKSEPPSAPSKVE